MLRPKFSEIMTSIRRFLVLISGTYRHEVKKKRSEKRRQERKNDETKGKEG